MLICHGVRRMSRRRNGAVLQRDSRSHRKPPTHSPYSPAMSTGMLSRGEAGGLSSRSANVCACHRGGLRAWLPLCMFVPLQRFGGSILPMPLMVLMRLILPAASLAVECVYTKKSWRTAVSKGPGTAVGARFSNSVLKPRRLGMESSPENVLAHLGHRVSTTEFLGEVASDPRYADWRVVSVTWVKALASHMSHEFVQFIAEDTATGTRARLIADRQETGDWISITPEPMAPFEMRSTFEGLSSRPWTKATPYKDRHSLPLPLVSLVFESDHGCLDTRPRLHSVADLVAGISAGCKDYNPLKEHCWWFSEAIIDAIRENFANARLEEWAWARYRYSFVVCNKWIRRRILEQAARAFETQCLQDLAY
jgi:hypothetical protein